MRKSTWTPPSACWMWASSATRWTTTGAQHTYPSRNRWQASAITSCASGTAPAGATASAISPPTATCSTTLRSSWRRWATSATSHSASSSKWATSIWRISTWVFVVHYNNLFPLFYQSSQQGAFRRSCPVPLRRPPSIVGLASGVASPKLASGDPLDVFPLESHSVFSVEFCFLSTWSSHFWDFPLKNSRGLMLRLS